MQELLPWYGGEGKGDAGGWGDLSPAPPLPLLPGENNIQILRNHSVFFCQINSFHNENEFEFTD